MGVYPMAELSEVQRRWLAQNLERGILAMRSAAAATKVVYVRRTREAKAVDTGNLMNRFMVEDAEFGAFVLNYTSYFWEVDQGRKPGGAPPPFEKLFQWVLRKRILGQTRASVNASADLTTQAEEVTRAIQTAIVRRGTKPRDIVGGPVARDQVRAIVTQTFEATMRRGAGPVR